MNGEGLNQVQQLLKSLGDAFRQRLVTKEQILQALQEESPSREEGYTKRLSLQEIFYIVGGLFAVLGVVLLVRQFWDDLSQPMRVLLTLGSSSAFYTLGYHWYRNRDTQVFSRVLFILFILLLPLGIGTFLDLIGISSINNDVRLSILSLLAFIPFLVSWIFLREPLFYFFSVLAGSAVFLFVTNLMAGKPSDAFYAYRFLIIGISTIACAWWARTRILSVSELLHGLGLVYFLSAGLYLVIAKESAWWLLFYPFVLGGVFLGSLKIQSRSTVTFAALYTIAYIMYVTFKYFAHTLGWPLAVIVVGIAIMGVGYFSVRLSKKYS